MNSKRNRYVLVRALNLQKWICHYCQVPLTLRALYELAPEIFDAQGIKYATLEHLLPAACGGKRTIDNVAASCGDCNNLRHDNPQCVGSRYLVYRGETIAERIGDYWHFTDGTKKRVGNSKLSKARNHAKRMKRRNK